MGAAMAGLRPGRARRFVLVTPQGAGSPRAARERALGCLAAQRQDRSSSAGPTPPVQPDAIAAAARAAANAPRREVLIVVGANGRQVGSCD